MESIKLFQELSIFFCKDIWLPITSNILRCHSQTRWSTIFIIHDSLLYRLGIVPRKDPHRDKMKNSETWRVCFWFGSRIRMQEAVPTVKGLLDVTFCDGNMYEGWEKSQMHFECAKLIAETVLHTSYPPGPMQCYIEDNVTGWTLHHSHCHAAFLQRL